MKKIKANVAENRYRLFAVVDELPKVGDIIEKGQYEVLAVNMIHLDPEQPNSDVYNYNYYEIVKKDLIDADAGEETIIREDVCVKWSDPVHEMFDEYAEKFGTVVWDGEELALTEDAYTDGPVADGCFRASAMDRDGNRWDVTWDILPGVDSNADYADQCDWDCPADAEMVDEGYYLEEY